MSNVNIEQSSDNLKNAPSAWEAVPNTIPNADANMPNAFEGIANSKVNPEAIVPTRNRFNTPGVGVTPKLPMFLYEALGIDPRQNGGDYVDEQTEDYNKRLDNLDSFSLLDAIKKNQQGEVAPNTDESKHNKLLNDFGIVGNSLAHRSEIISGFETADYEKYIKGGMYNLSNIDDVRALNQSNGEAILNIGTRFVGTTVQALVEPWVQMAAIPVIGGMAAAGKDMKLSNIYDNQVTRGMDDLNESLKELMPVFSTKAQEESSAFSAINLSSARFWDSFTNGVAFTVGTAINAWLTGGLLTSIKGANATKSIGKMIVQLDKVGGDTQKLAALLNNPSALNMMSKGADISKLVGGVARQSSRLTSLSSSLFAAGAEGGIEAREVGRELKGSLDKLVANGELSREEADNRLEKAMNTVYGLNTLIVGFSTHLQFAGLLAGRAPKAAGAKVFLDKGLKKGVNKLTAREVLPSTWGNIYRKTFNIGKETRFTKFLDFAQYSSPILTSGISEAGEEGSQFIVAKAVKDHYATKVGKDYANAIIEATDELFSSKEGKESLAIGAAIGALGSGIRIKSTLKELKTNNAVANALNSRLNSEDSLLNRAIVNVGKAVINNKNAVRAETSKVKDEELLEVFKDQQFNDFVEYLYNTGTYDTVKEYINETLEQSPEDLAKDFDVFKGVNENTRKDIASTLTTRIDKLVKLRRNIDENFTGLIDGVKSALFQVEAFSMQTKEIYNKYIEQLDKEYGVNVKNINKEAKIKYEQDKLADYQGTLDKAYTTYKNSLGEGVTADTKNTFILNHPELTKEAHSEEYDKRANEPYNLDDLVGDQIKNKAKINFANNAIAKIANDKIEKALSNLPISSNIRKSGDLYEKYENLQTSYLQADNVVRYIGAKENENRANKQYHEEVKKAVIRDVKAGPASHVDKFAKKVKNAKSTDIENLKDEGGKLLDRIDEEIADVVNTLESKDSTEEEKDIAANKQVILSSTRAKLKSDLDNLKNKGTVATTSSKAEIVETEAKEEVKDEKNKVLSKLQIVNSRVVRASNFLEDVFDSEQLKDNKTLESSVIEQIEVSDALLSDIAILNEDIRSLEKVEPTKVNQAIEDINVKVVELEGSVENIKNTLISNNAKNTSNPIVVTDSTLNDDLGLTGDDIEDSKTVAATLVDILDSNETLDPNVRFTMSIQEGQTEGAKGKTATLGQLGLKIFGDNRLQNGLIASYIKRESSSNFDDIWNSPESMAVVIEEFIREFTGKPISANVYNFLIRQYFSFKEGAISVNDYKYLNFDVLATIRHQDEAISFTNPFLKSFTFNKKHHDRASGQKNYNYGDSISNDRVTVEGNDSLIRLIDQDVVYEGAEATIELLDTPLEVKIGDSVETISPSSILKKIKEGKLDEVSINEVLALPLDIKDSNNNKIGWYKTPNDIKNARDKNRLSTGAINGISSYIHEQNAMLEARLQMLFYMATNDTTTVPTTISHRGAGFLKSTEGNEKSNKAKLDKVSANIKIKGSKILIAKRKGVSVELYENDDVSFDMSSVHNQASMGNLINGIPYIAIPALTNKSATMEGNVKTKYMIIPLQSVKLKDINEGDLNYYDFANQKYKIIVDGKHISMEDKSKTIGERARQSITNAIGIYVKLAELEGTNTKAEDVLTKSELAILNTFTEAGYNISDIIGLRSYINQLTYTYDTTPMDFGKGTVKGFSIDRILSEHILDKEFSTVRISAKKIEVGKVQDGVGTVISIFIDKGNVTFAKYNIDPKVNTDNKKRSYVKLEGAEYRSKLLYGIYEALETAYLKVDASKLNKNESHKLPLVNLVNGEPIKISNGNAVSVLYKTQIDEDSPVDAEGIKMDSYDDYAANTLKTDVATHTVSSSADTKNYKDIYSAFAVVAINTENIADLNKSKTFNGMTISQFKHKLINSAKNSKVKEGGVTVKRETKEVIEPANAPKVSNKNKADESNAVTIIKNAAKTALNKRGNLSTIKKQVFVEQLKDKGLSSSEAQAIIDSLVPEGTIKRTIDLTSNTEVNDSFNASEFYKKSPATDIKGNPIRFRSASKAFSLRDNLNRQLMGTGYHMVYHNNSSPIKGESHILIMVPSNDNLILFGKDYIDLFNTISADKGFLPFVNPGVLNSLIKQFSIDIMNILIDKNSTKADKNKAVSTIINNEIAEWDINIAELKEDIQDLNEKLEEDPSNTNAKEQLEYFNHTLNMLESLKTNIDIVVDSVVKELMSDNMVTGSFKEGNLTVKSSDSSSFKGKSVEGQYETDTSIVDIIEDEIPSEEDDLDKFVSEVEDIVNNWDDAGLGADYSKKTSVVVKTFLKGIVKTELDANNEVTIVRNKLGKPEIISYKEAYTKVLRALSNKQHSVESGLEVLDAYGESDPFYREVAKKLRAEIADTNSNLPFEFFKLVNKTRISMKYLWIAPNNKKEGGRVNKIGDSNKSNNKATIMDQWQTLLMSSNVFVKNYQSGEVVINNKAINEHIADFEIAHKPIDALYKNIYENERSNNSRSISNINASIESYNKSIRPPSQNKGMMAMNTLDKITSIEDIANLKAKLNKSVNNYIRSFTIPVGFVFSDATINSLINTTYGTSNSNKAVAYFMANSNNFKDILKSLAELGNDTDLNVVNIESNFKKAVNPLITEESKFNQGVSPDVWRDSTNKAIYAYTNYKYMDEVLSDLHDSFIPENNNSEGQGGINSVGKGNLFADINNTAFGANSYLLNDLMVRINEINKDKVANQNTHNNANNLVFDFEDAIVINGSNNKSRSVKINELQEGDLEVYKLMRFLNRDGKDGYFYYPTLSDGKSILSLPMKKIDIAFDGRGKTLKLNVVTIDSVFDKSVMPEINRIIDAAMFRAEGGKVDIEGFEQGSRNFILHPFLNKLLKKDENGNHIIGTDKEFRRSLEERAKEELGKELDKRIKAKVAEWESIGIAYKGDMNIIDDKSKKGRNLNQNAYQVAADFELNYLVFYTGVNQIFMGDTSAYWNGRNDGDAKSSVENMSKRLAGHRGPGEVGVTMTDSETMTVVTLNDVKTVSSAAVFLESVKKGGSKALDSTDGQELTSLYEDLSNRVTYDGMSRSLFNALYNDEDAIIFKAFQRMFEGEKNEDFNYDDYILEGLKSKDSINEGKPNYYSLADEYSSLVNQPMKPMYFNNVMTRTNDRHIRSAVYIKSSSFALSPSLTKNFAIDKLRKTMDYSTYEFLKYKRKINKATDKEVTKEYHQITRKEEGIALVDVTKIREHLIAKAKEKMIDRVAFKSAVKLGANSNNKLNTEADIFGFDKGNYETSYNNLMRASNVYPRKGFRKQQELPFDVDKSAIGSGSQERKLIFNGLLDLAISSNNDVIRELKKEFDGIYNYLYKDGYDTLMKELMADGKVDYKKLSEIIVNEGISRGYDSNDLAELELNPNPKDGASGFLNSLMFHRRDTSIESLVLSIVKNRILKIKLPGRSLVLGTEAGFETVTKNGKLETDNHDRDGVIYTSSFKGKLMSHGFLATEDIEVNGRSYKEGDYLHVDDINAVDGKYKYQPDQIIIPSFFKDAKGNLINLKERGVSGKYRYIKEVDNRLMLNEDIFDKETLRTFGFRIPTQGHSSMASMEIVGFTDVKVGELVIAPKEFTLRMGSDFDIDKLYMYRHAIGKDKNKFIKSVGTERDIKTNRLLDIHNEVFMNPDPVIQKAIASPLSYGFFKEEGSIDNSNYKPDSSIEELFSSMRKDREDYVLGEFIEDLYGESNEVESPLSTKYQSDFYNKGKMGKTGIAMFSSRSVINSILQQSHYEGRPTEMGKIGKKGFDNTAYDFTLGGHKFSGANFGNNKTVDNSDFSVADVISWYQSTAVDNAKLNKLHKLNINEVTLDVVNFLNQAGFHEHVLWFINQPIIRDYAKVLNNSKNLIGKNYNKLSPEATVREMYNVGSFDKNKSFRNQTDYTNYRNSIADMANNIKEYKNYKDSKGSNKVSPEDLNYFGTQLAILEEFLYLQEHQAAEFKGLATILNTDSKGLGDNVNQFIIKRNKLLALTDPNSSIKNAESLIGTFMTEKEYNLYKTKHDTSDVVKIGDYYIKPNGVVGSSTVYSIAAFETIFKNDFLQFKDEFQTAINRIIYESKLNLSSGEESKLASVLLTNYKKFAHSNGLLKLGVDIEAKYNELLIDEIVNEKDDNGNIINTYISKKSLASRINEIQTGLYHNDPFIASIVATKGGFKKVADIKFNNMSGLNDTDGKVVGALYNLVNKNPVLIEIDEVTGKPYTARELISDMFYYSEITGGIQRFGEIVKFMPYELKKLIGFNEGLNSTINDIKADNKAYITQFIQHHPQYAADITYTDKDRGVQRLSALRNKLSEDENGNPFIIPEPVYYRNIGAITHLMINPTSFKITDKNKISVFNRKGELVYPPVVKTVFRDSKTKKQTTTLYKLKYTDYIGEGIKIKGLNDKVYTPLIIEGQLVYERVEELGSGTKSEYDASIDIDTSKLSALNANTRIKYHATTDLKRAIFFKSDNPLDNVFGDFSASFLQSSLDHISKNSKANAITRVMAAMLRDNNVVNHVKVLKLSEIKDLEATTPFLINLKNQHSTKAAHSNLMSFLMDHKNGKGYIVINDAKVENAKNINTIQNGFIHEMMHFIVDRDFKIAREGESQPAYISEFKKNGQILLKEAIDYYTNNPDKQAWGNDNVDITFIIKALNSIVRGTAINNASLTKEIKDRTGLDLEGFKRKYANYYGLTNFDEFYAELGSNDTFVEMMSNIPSSNFDNGNSKIIERAKDVNGVKGDINNSILSSFINIFKKLFTDIINTIFKGHKGEGKLVIKDNSIAQTAILELIISAKHHSKIIDAYYKKGISNPLETNTKTEADNVIDSDSAFDDDGTFETEDDYAIVEDTVTQAGETFDDDGSFEEEENFDIEDDLKYSPTSDLNNIVEIVGKDNYSFSDNDNISIVDDAKTEEILRTLNKNNRLDFACKL